MAPTDAGPLAIRSIGLQGRWRSWTQSVEHQPIGRHRTPLVIATSGLCLTLPWRRPQLRRENYV